MPACRSWSTARPTTRSAPAEMASWMERFVARGRRQPDRRLLRHQRPAYPGAGRDAADGAAAVPPGAGRAQAGLDSVGRQPLQPGLAAPGEQLSSPSASAATPTARRSGASCRRSTTGTAASRWAASRSAKARNSLDICTAFVGRDEMAEMNEVITRFTASVNAPLVIDSTETPVIEAALKLHGGKPIINSINFEDGEKRRLRPAEARQEVRRGGDRADHRRRRAWRRRPRTSCAIARRLVRFRLQQARPAAVRPADRPADLHHRHRQRGRPQARRNGRSRASG